jgi:hypothetical protein
LEAETAGFPGQVAAITAAADVLCWLGGDVQPGSQQVLKPRDTPEITDTLKPTLSAKRGSIDETDK